MEESIKKHTWVTLKKGSIISAAFFVGVGKQGIENFDCEVLKDCTIYTEADLLIEKRQFIGYDES